MIKITIDENILKLTPRSRKIGKRLLWGWVSLQVFTVVLILAGVIFFVWVGSHDYFGQMRAEKFGEESSASIQQGHNKTE